MVGHLKRICKDAFRVAGAVQETCSSEMLGGQGADFLGGEHLIFRFAKMILRDTRSTSYELASLVCGRCSTLDRWSGKKRKTLWHKAVSSALNFSIFEGSLADLLPF